MLFSSNIEREKTRYKSLSEMAPCQVHPVIIHTSSSAVNARTPPVRPTSGVRRNLFGQPDPREMVRTFDNENARQRKRLDNYKIIEPITQSKTTTSIINKDETQPPNNNESFPSLIAKELEAHEKEMQKQKEKQKSTDEVSSSSSMSQRQEQIETTPTLSAKAKLRTLHTNSRANSDTAIEDARYRPYTRQTLITDVMPKRKSIPPP